MANKLLTVFQDLFWCTEDKVESQLCHNEARECGNSYETNAIYPRHLKNRIDVKYLKFHCKCPKEIKEKCS